MRSLVNVSCQSSMKRQSGMTLIEVSVVIVVMTLGIVGAMGVLDQSSEFVAQSTSRLKTEESARLAIERLVKTISESSVRFMDTSMRVHSGVVNISSDRFTFSGFPFSQCISLMCRFHTDSTTVFDMQHYDCGHEYRLGFGSTTSVVRGKVWPELLAQCPLDGSPTTSMTTMDCLKLFTARQPNGEFSTSGGSGSEPDWNTIVILAPYSGRENGGQLRQYSIGVSDLLAGTVVSSGDTPLDGAPPDMIALFDFGTDGTMNGVPDGSVPLLPADSDARSEAFFVGTFMGEPALIYSKTLNDSTTYPWRVASLIVRLSDGRTQFSVMHQYSNSSFWDATCDFTRPPEVILNNLTEFAVSTAVSNPYDPLTNARGVASSGIVRVTIGTTALVLRDGGKQWNHHIETVVIQPLN